MYSQMEKGLDEKNKIRSYGSIDVYIYLFPPKHNLSFGNYRNLLEVCVKYSVKVYTWNKVIPQTPKGTVLKAFGVRSGVR